MRHRRYKRVWETPSEYEADTVGSTAGTIIGIVIIGMALFFLAMIVFYIALAILPIVIVIWGYHHFQQHPLNVSSTSKHVIITLIIIALIGYYGVFGSQLIASNMNIGGNPQQQRQINDPQVGIKNLINNVWAGLNSVANNQNDENLPLRFVNNENNGAYKQLTSWAKSKYQSTLNNSNGGNESNIQLKPNIKSISHINGTTYKVVYQVTLNNDKTQRNKPLNCTTTVQRTNNGGSWQIVSNQING